MKQINLIGPYFGTSGYDSHMKGLFNGLNKLCEVKLSVQVPNGAEKIMSDRELEAIKRKDKREINLIITNPSMWKLHLNAKINCVFLIFEGDKIPKWIIENCLDERIDYIFVASNHTRDAIVRTLHEDYSLNNPFKDGTQIPRGLVNNTLNIIYPKIRVINHGVDLNLFYPKEIKKDKFTLLINKGWRHLYDRGGTQYAVKAYLEEFTEKDNIKLIAKLNPCYGIPNIKEFVKQLTNKTENIPEIIFDITNYPYEQLVNIYNQADLFLMTTRAEAFGIPCAEAAACKLPSITSNFGGQTDFVNDKNSWIVNGKLEEVDFDLFYEGISWLTPDINEIRKIMRYAYEHQEEVKQKGEQAFEDVKKFTWDKSAEKIMEALKCHGQINEQ